MASECCECKRRSQMCRMIKHLRDPPSFPLHLFFEQFNLILFVGKPHVIIRY